MESCNTPKGSQNRLRGTACQRGSITDEWHQKRRKRQKQPKMPMGVKKSLHSFCVERINVLSKIVTPYEALLARSSKSEELLRVSLRGIFMPRIGKFHAESHRFQANRHFKRAPKPNFQKRSRQGEGTLLSILLTAQVVPPKGWQLLPQGSPLQRGARRRCAGGPRHGSREGQNMFQKGKRWQVKRTTLS